MRAPTLPFIFPGARSRRIGLAVVWVALVLLFGVGYEGFLTVDNGLVTAQNVSSLAIAVVGAMALLIAGYVDLSIGSMFGLVAILVAYVARDSQDPLLAVAAGLGAGLALGALNGELVRRLPVSPLIVTLAMLLVYRGAAYALTDGRAVFGFPDAFTQLGRAEIVGVPLPVVVAVVVYTIGALVLTTTVAGLRVYAIGGNREAARVQGVPVDRYVVSLYALGGLLVGLVAVLTTARLGSGTPALGTQFELDVLTAVILGGIAFTGGSGRPGGVLVGVATIGTLNAGLLFAGFQDWYQQMAKGFVLLLALAGDQLARTRRRGKATRPTATDVKGRSELLRRGSLRGSRPAGETPVLTCTGLTRSYGSVMALRDGRVSVAPGEVVCIVGDNGAGKSTLIKIVSGALRPDAGTIELDGRARSFGGPADARAAGIHTVYQDLALCPNLGVAHNLVLGAEPRRRYGPLALRDDRRAAERSRERLAELGIELDDVSRPVGGLSGGQRQSVAIARALDPDVRVVVLDEPTAALGVRQTRNVLRVVRAAAERGAGVILISHDIETVFAIADRVVVLRLGEVVHEGNAHALSESDLIHLMAGVERPLETTA